MKLREPQPQQNSDLSARLAAMDDREDQEKARKASHAYLKKLRSKAAGLAELLLTGEVDPRQLCEHSTEPCTHCHTQPEGRRKELTDLGWSQQGWGWESTEWLNVPKTYYVLDRVIDTMPEEEWQFVRSMTNVESADRANPTPPAKAYVVGGSGSMGGKSAGGAGG